MNEKFKISGIGLDTVGMCYSPSSEDLYEYYDYIHTSIEENNDFLISDFIKSQVGSPLITSIGFTSNMIDAISGHLLELNRDKIDLLLINSECDWNSENIKLVKESNIVDKIGISNPNSLSKLKEIISTVENNIGIRIEFISLSLCPINFRYDIIKWCKEMNIKILGFNPFGGRFNYYSLIESFTVPYLLGFSSTYCDVVFLSGRELFRSNSEYRYLKDLIGKETESKYVLKKSISKLQKPLKKVISESLVLSDNLIIPIDSPDLLYMKEELHLSLIEPVEKLLDNGKDSISSIITEYLNNKDIDTNLSPQAMFSINRYFSLGYLKIEYPNWEMDTRRLGDLLSVTVLRKEEKKSWISKKEIKSKTILMGMIGKNRDSFYITEIY